MTTNATSNLPLPDAFLNFLKENDLDPAIYTACDSLPRYIRLKPGCEDQVEEIEAEIKCELSEVDWLPGFYSLPPHFHIANTKAYREGKIYGIDASSGAAIMALNISPGDHVLDLCAAPGAKLCMILDLLSDTGSVTGVDVARHRLAACRTMIQKYNLGDCCRLFVADGTKFSLKPCRLVSASKEGEHISEEKLDLFREWTSRRPWKERKRAAKARESNSMQLSLPGMEPELIYYGRHSGVIGCTRDELFHIAENGDFSGGGYDKVLVDAECTHDGSIRHVQKFEHWGWQTLQQRVLDADRTDSLTNLQLQLLSNGFRLLKTGGLLIYSTCSLTVSQNEDVVVKFLSDNKSAELQEIDAARNWPCKSGRIPKTLSAKRLKTMEGKPARASSLRWEILRQALLHRRASDDRCRAGIDRISRRAKRGFNLIPFDVASDEEVRLMEAEDSRTDLDCGGGGGGGRDVCLRYTLPVESAPKLFLFQRVDRADMNDFEICNKHRVDYTGLVCQWPSEDVLAYYCLMHSSMFRSKRVIELGSGYGLAGLVIATVTEALEVIITDGNPEVVGYIRRNIAANAGAFGNTTVETMVLHWDHENFSNLSDTFDIVIASDCTFFKEFHKGLARTVNLLLKNSGPSEAIFFNPRRGDSLDKFVEEIKENGLRFSLSDKYDGDVWNRHEGLINGDESWPNYEKDHCYPLLLRIFR